MGVSGWMQGRGVPTAQDGWQNIRYLRPKILSVAARFERVANDVRPQRSALP